jgi:hypothetical protein
VIRCSREEPTIPRGFKWHRHLWAADEAADRASVEATVSALNNSPMPSIIFTADFPNAAELEGLREESRSVILRPADGVTIRTQAGTLVISREPMGEAAWYSAVATTALAPRFVTRSVTFTTADTAVVIAVYERPFTSQKKARNASFRFG